MIVQRISLDFEYPVHFTERVFALENLTLMHALSHQEPALRHRMLFVLDSELAHAWPTLDRNIHDYAAHHSKRLELVAEPMIVPGGEAVKNQSEVLEKLYTQLHDHGLDRHSFVVAVGGGAVLDAVGYAAATTHRGIRCVRLPTTVLSQADGGVGVKNGINAFGKKNFLGSFAPPFAVVCDSHWFSTLSRREASAGYAEGVKVALLKDPGFFAWIQEHVAELHACEEPAMAQLVRRSAELHLEHIASAGDPFELGSARPLDFGHWSAHKLEVLTEYGLRHGEAVAIGMALDTVYAEITGLSDPGCSKKVLSVLQQLGLPIWDEKLTSPELLAGLREFREHLGGELNITLLRAVGQPVQVSSMDEGAVKAAVQSLKHRLGGA